MVVVVEPAHGATKVGRGYCEQFATAVVQILVPHGVAFELVLPQLEIGAPELGWRAEAEAAVPVRLTLAYLHHSSDHLRHACCSEMLSR